MFLEAGFNKHVTNHSLRATGATELLRCGVPEKIIMKRTGHKSIDGVRAYERTTAEQQMAASKVLTDRNCSKSGCFNDIVKVCERPQSVHEYCDANNENDDPKAKRSKLSPIALFPGKQKSQCQYVFQGCKVTFMQGNDSGNSDLDAFDQLVLNNLDKLF